MTVCKDAYATALMDCQAVIMLLNPDIVFSLVANLWIMIPYVAV